MSGFLRVRGQREELRFAPGTTIPEIRRALDQRRRQLEAILPESPLRGSVRALVEQFVKTLGTTRGERETQARLQSWVNAVGDRPFTKLTRAELQDVVATWRQAGKSASTIAKRISSLRQVWKRYAPEEAPPHAIERLARPREPRGDQIRARPLDLIARVLDNLDRKNQATGEMSKAVVRLQLLAWTGQPPALLQQLRPEHVRWQAQPPEIWVQPRRKGAGVDAGWIPLLPPAITALQRFFAIGAEGEWNRGVLRRAWRRALKRTQIQLRKADRHDEAAALDGMRVYDLRHSALTAIGTASGDLHAVSAYARHADVRTTMRYLRGAADERMRQAIQALALTLPASLLGSTPAPKRSPRRKAR